MFIYWNTTRRLCLARHTTAGLIAGRLDPHPLYRCKFLGWQALCKDICNLVLGWDVLDINFL